MVFYTPEGGMHMDSLKLLIADANEDFRLALSQALQGAYHVRSCQTGTEALAQIRSFRPDILVLDLMLPELDGITLLEEAAAGGTLPMVLVATSYVNGYVVEAAGRLGIGYIMRKPCDIKAVLSRVGDLSQHLQPPALTLPDPRSSVSNLLLALGIPTKLRGYTYLREAILIMAQDPNQSITKELYPKVAALCGCEPKHVERSSRSAIHNAWLQRDDRGWKLYFPPGPDGTVPRPTNGDFISRLAESLRLREDN